MKQVLIRLLSGETVHVGSLGGSITEGKDARPGKNYFELVTAWLSKAFPNARVVGRNGAIAAMTSMYMERIMNLQLDPEVDLVFLDFSLNNFFNETTMDYEDVQSFERLLRAVLTGSHYAETKLKPAAAIIMNMWLSSFWNGSSYELYPYHQNLGDHFNILAQYYAVPSITVRNGLYQAYLLGGGMFNNSTEAYPPNQYRVTLHPGQLGHKYLADMIIYAFYVVLGQLQQNFGLTQGDLDIMCKPLLPPMVAERHHNFIIRSWYGDQLKKVVSAASGWEFGVIVGKAGFTATVPGSKLVFQFDTSMTSGMMQHHPRLIGVPIDVHLGMLRSYNHMGEVQVTCVAGCRCTPVIFDTNHPQDRHSLTYPYVVTVSESSSCILQLECLNASTSIDKEHKVVISGVSVSVTLRESGGEGNN